MKTSIFSFLICVVVFWGCGESDGDKLQNFIPGLYAHSFVDSITETTKTVGMDTLVIKEAATGSEHYEIERRMQFTRNVDGQLKLPEYKVENWKGVYDKEKHVIQETSKGKIISFIPDKNLLLVNNVEYKKLK